MYNTIQCSNRFRLLTKLCLPAEEHKNSFLGLTSSSQGEVTREMAVTSECKASKATTSVRLSEDQVWWASVLLSAAALCTPRLGSEQKVTGQHRIKNGMGYHTFTLFCLYQLPIVSFYNPSWPCYRIESNRKHDTQWKCVPEPGRTFKHYCSNRSFLSILGATGK